MESLDLIILKAIADVVDRFIKIINPNKIYFGEKDFQQLIIIEDFVKKNHPKCKVVPCKTIREKKWYSLFFKKLFIE